MKKNRETIPPVIVADRPGEGGDRQGEAIDQTEFPVPKWHYLEGGRYIHTFTSIVTRDPDTGVMNVGMYRGMIGQKNTTPFLLIKGGQHWGAHFVKWAARGQADAGRLRDRLGPDHVVSVGLADCRRASASGT